MAELVDTPRGPARVHADDPAGELRGLLVLGHGAGGGITAPDVVAVTEEAVRLGLAVRRVEQPYRVAGRRAPPPAGHLDEAWLAVLAGLIGTTGLAEPTGSGSGAPGLTAAPGRPLLVGGRSSGARVACRTAAAVAALIGAAPGPGAGPRVGAAPGRRAGAPFGAGAGGAASPVPGGDAGAAAGLVGVVCLAFPVHPPGRPDRSRLPELDAVTVPTLVVQGDRDPFGMPPARPGRTLLVVPGADHGLRRGLAGVREAFAGWLGELGITSG